MYQKLKEKSSSRRDRVMPVILIVSAVFFIAVLTPAFIAASGSYRYHRFVQDISGSLVDARSGGDIIMVSGTEQKKLSADRVSGVLVDLTDAGLGQPIKDVPDADNILITFPDGSSLTLYDTPDDNGLEEPSGVTVRYEGSDGKVFMYLQRYIVYGDLLWRLSL